MFILWNFHLLWNKALQEAIVCYWYRCDIHPKDEKETPRSRLQKVLKSKGSKSPREKIIDMKRETAAKREEFKLAQLRTQKYTSGLYATQKSFKEIQEIKTSTRLRCRGERVLNAY